MASMGYVDASGRRPDGRSHVTDTLQVCGTKTFRRADMRRRVPAHAWRGAESSTTTCNEVANREHAHDIVAVDHGQMAISAVDDQHGRALDRVVGRSRVRVRSHALTHHRVVAQPYIWAPET